MNRRDIFKLALGAAAASVLLPTEPLADQTGTGTLVWTDAVPSGAILRCDGEWCVWKEGKWVETGYRLGDGSKIQFL